MLFGGEDGCYAISLTSVLAGLYGFLFFNLAHATPKAPLLLQAQNQGLEVTSKDDFIFYLIMNIPMYIALGVLA